MIWKVYYIEAVVEGLRSMETRAFAKTKAIAGRKVQGNNNKMLITSVEPLMPIRHEKSP